MTPKIEEKVVRIIKVILTDIIVTPKKEKKKFFNPKKIKIKESVH
jgi:hypothetical protein